MERQVNSATKMTKSRYAISRRICSCQIKKGSGPSIGRGHVAEIKRHRRLAHREIDISRDKRTGKSQVKTPT
jgi:hypothetical protein